MTTKAPGDRARISEAMVARARAARERREALADTRWEDQPVQGASSMECRARAAEEAAQEVSDGDQATILHWMNARCPTVLSHEYLGLLGGASAL